MHRVIIDSSILLLSSFLFFTQTCALEKRFKTSQISTPLLKKMIDRLQVEDQTHYDSMSISNNGCPAWIKLRSNTSSSKHGFLIDSHHYPELIGEIDELYAVKK